MLLNLWRMVGDKGRKNRGFCLIIKESSAPSESEASLFIASFYQLSRPNRKEDTGVKEQERVMPRGR